MLLFFHYLENKFTAVTLFLSLTHFNCPKMVDSVEVLLCKNKNLSETTLNEVKVET